MPSFTLQAIQDILRSVGPAYVGDRVPGAFRCAFDGVPRALHVARVLHHLIAALLHRLGVGGQRQTCGVLLTAFLLKRLDPLVNGQRQEVVALVQLGQGLGGRISDPLVVLDHFVDAAPSSGLGQYRGTAQPLNRVAGDLPGFDQLRQGGSSVSGGALNIGDPFRHGGELAFRHAGRVAGQRDGGSEAPPFLCTLLVRHRQSSGPGGGGGERRDQRSNVATHRLDRRSNAPEQVFQLAALLHEDIERRLPRRQANSNVGHLHRQRPHCEPHFARRHGGRCRLGLGRLSRLAHGAQAGGSRLARRTYLDRSLLGLRARGGQLVEVSRRTFGLGTVDAQYEGCDFISHKAPFPPRRATSCSSSAEPRTP
ncbi:Uncharacterised protein [Bordetella pertussis]|nr:Uncharacterised protein [Bordetella pertussis]